MSKFPVVALGFVLIVLLGALTVPAAIDTSDGTVQTSVTLEEGESQLITENLDIIVEETNNADATITLVYPPGSESNTQIIDEGSTVTYSFEEGDVMVTNVDSTNQRVTLLVEYDSTFGYSDAGVIVSENIGIILVAMLLISIVSFVGVKP